MHSKWDALEMRSRADREQYRVANKAKHHFSLLGIASIAAEESLLLILR